MEKRCDNCDHYQKWELPVLGFKETGGAPVFQGYCRRRAPILADKQPTGAGFPVMFSCDRCGDWESAWT
jgi:hypothetical protein